MWIFFSPSLNGLISPASLFHSVHWAVFSRYWSHDPRRPSNPTWPPSSMSSSLHVEVPPQSLTPHPPREFSGLSEVIRSFEKKESGAEESWRQLSELQPLGNEQTNKALKAVVSSLDDLTWRPGECPGVVIYSFFFQKHFTSAGKGKGQRWWWEECSIGCTCIWQTGRKLSRRNPLKLLKIESELKDVELQKDVVMWHEEERKTTERKKKEKGLGRMST